MATVYGIEVAGETYDIEDTNARQGVETNANDIDGIEGKIPSSASSSNKLATKEDIASALSRIGIGESTAITGEFPTYFKLSAGSVAAYNPFSGSTPAGNEGSWWGWKQSATRFWAIAVFSGGTVARLSCVDGNTVTATKILG